jgi:hypothetical protein
MSDEAAVRDVISRIDAAWRLKKFDGLEECFHPEAVIVGPGYAELGRGRARCAESYREFATNAAVMSYSESGQALRLWDTTAVYTFAWEMTYRRAEGTQTETGTDQLVFQLGPEGWQLVFRFMDFKPSS